LHGRPYWSCPERRSRRRQDQNRNTLATLGQEQKTRLESLASEIRLQTQRQQEDQTKLRAELIDALKDLGIQQRSASELQSQQQRERLDGVARVLTELTRKQEEAQAGLRTAVEQRLDQLRNDNAEKLEKIRHTVDEQLQGTLDKRLGESFKQVSDRLEQVHKGLGEMQSLASGVGDLKRVLTNVKTRGTWGEVQLGSLLEQVLTPDQYLQDAQTRPGSAEWVEFAIRLPGRGDGELEVLLPIDAKFPQEDYERLVLAADRADIEAVEAASKQLETRIRNSAKEIRNKYINPPQTTDFAILFLRPAARAGRRDATGANRECRAWTGPASEQTLAPTTAATQRASAMASHTAWKLPATACQISWPSTRSIWRCAISGISDSAVWARSTVGLFG
jgi:DNA recombination protein RmuC